MGVASLSCTPPDTDSARYHLEAAKDMMDKLLEDLDEEVRAVKRLVCSVVSYRERGWVEGEGDGREGRKRKEWKRMIGKGRGWKRRMEEKGGKGRVEREG